MSKIVFSFILLVSQVSLGFEFYQNARTVMTHKSGLVEKSLASACLTIQIDGQTPCNPAIILDKESSLNFVLISSNGYQNLSKVSSLFSNEINSEFLDAILGDNTVLQYEGGIELQLISSNFRFSYTPLYMNYLSVTSNRINPTVNIIAHQNSLAKIQYAHSLNTNVQLGIQTRWIDGKVIQKDVPLLELATEEGKNLMSPDNYKAFLIEPSAIYNHSDQIKSTVMISYLGWKSEPYKIFPSPAFDLGISHTSQFEYADLQIEIARKTLIYNENENHKYKLGAQVLMGSMTLASGVDYYGLSFGTYYKIKNLNTGVSYSTTKVPWRSDDVYADTVYLQLGLHI